MQRSRVNLTKFRLVTSLFIVLDHKEMFSFNHQHTDRPSCRRHALSIRPDISTSSIRLRLRTSNETIPTNERFQTKDPITHRTLILRQTIKQIKHNNIRVMLSCVRPHQRRSASFLRILLRLVEIGAGAVWVALHPTPETWTMTSGVDFLCRVYAHLHRGRPRAGLRRARIHVDSAACRSGASHVIDL